MKFLPGEHPGGARVLPSPLQLQPNRVTFVRYTKGMESGTDVEEWLFFAVVVVAIAAEHGPVDHLRTWSI